MKETKTWSVTCIKAALGYERYEKLDGTLALTASENWTEPTWKFHPSGVPWERGITITDLAKWEFGGIAKSLPEEAGAAQPPPDYYVPIADAKVSDGYDSDAFARDLDAAITRAQRMFGNHKELFEPQLSFRRGDDVPKALTKVMMALVWRTIAYPAKEDALALNWTKVRDLLISKNKAYGNSALDPLRVFSQASVSEQLMVRLDDKVSRLERGAAAGEDVAQDMLGYLLLVIVAQIREERTRAAAREE